MLSVSDSSEKCAFMHTFAVLFMGTLSFSYNTILVNRSRNSLLQAHSCYPSHILLTCICTRDKVNNISSFFVKHIMLHNFLGISSAHHPSYAGALHKSSVQILLTLLLGARGLCCCVMHGTNRRPVYMWCMYRLLVRFHYQV